MIRPEVGVADLLHSIVAIAPMDSAEWARIASVLGFRVAPPPETRPTVQLPPAPTDAGMQGAPRVVTVDAATTPVEHSLPLLAPTGRRPTRQSRRFDRVPTLQAELSIGKASPPALEPLLRPLTAAATLRTVALVPHSVGPIDEQAVVRHVASRTPLTRIPRRRGWRLAADVLILEDWGEGMAFFIDDLQQLGDALRLVVGKDNVRVTGFVGDIATPATEAGLQSGTVVLIASDLGISRLAEPEERDDGRWNEIVDAVSAAGAHLLVVTPYGSDRWPPSLARRLPIVSWDRSTTVGAVLKVIRARA